jgi:SSS family solute:Na+ symporter
MAFSFTLAWTISPIALQRIQAARNVRVARQGLFATAGTLFVLYGFAVLIGILSLPLFPGQNPSGPLVSEIIASSAGPVFGRVLFVAVLAAILSTMDTAVNTGALSLTRDVYLQFFRSPKVGPVQAGRLATLVVGVSAFLIAGRFQSILKTIGLSSEIMAEGLFVPGIAMIFMKKRFPMAGLLSLCLGEGFSIMSFLGEMHVLPLHLPVWPFSVPYGISLSLLGFGTGMALERVKKS